MQEQVTMLLGHLQTLLKEKGDRDGFNFDLIIPGGKIQITAEKVLDPLPDNVIPFPRQ